MDLKEEEEEDEEEEIPHTVCFPHFWKYTSPFSVQDTSVLIIKVPQFYRVFVKWVGGGELFSCRAPWRNIL